MMHPGSIEDFNTVNAIVRFMFYKTCIGSCGTLFGRKGRTQGSYCIYLSEDTLKAKTRFVVVELEGR